MFSILKSIFASPENTSKSLDALINTGDALFFTDEEKSKASQVKMDWYLKYLDSTKSQNVARRLIAVVITGLFSFLVVLATLIYPLSVTYSTFVFTVLKDVVMLPFSGIIGFYFLKQIVQK